jgi:hypothetical protein
MPLRTDRDDNSALYGAYSRWLQEMADGAHTEGKYQVLWRNGEQVGMVSDFIREARARGWVEFRGDGFYISEAGKKALAAFYEWKEREGK